MVAVGCGCKETKHREEKKKKEGGGRRRIGEGEREEKQTKKGEKKGKSDLEKLRKKK